MRLDKMTDENEKFPAQFSVNSAERLYGVGSKARLNQVEISRRIVSVAIARSQKLLELDRRFGLSACKKCKHWRAGLRSLMLELHSRIVSGVGALYSRANPKHSRADLKRHPPNYNTE